MPKRHTTFTPDTPLPSVNAEFDRLYSLLGSVRTVEQANSFSAMQLVAFDTGAGQWVLAQASLAGLDAEGLVTEADAQTFTVVLGRGYVEQAHGKSVGTHWLHTTTPGASTTTRPGPGSREQRVFRVHDAEHLLVLLEPGLGGGK